MNVPICTGGVGVMNLGWDVRYPPNFGILCDLQLKFVVCIDVFNTAVTMHSPEVYFLPQNAPKPFQLAVGLYLDPMGELTALPRPYGASNRGAFEKGKG